MKHFLNSFFGEKATRIEFTEEAASFLKSYSWSGNVRELKSFCERLSVIHQEGVVDESFVKRLLEYHDESSSIRFGSMDTKIEIERALAQASGRIGKAAEILGVHRTTLWRKLKSVSPNEYHFRGRRSVNHSE